MECCLIVTSNDVSTLQLSDFIALERPLSVLRWPEDRDFAAQYPHWILRLPDNALRECLTLAESTEAVLHILSHPEARHSRRGFCCSPSSIPFKEAELARPIVKIDILRCNEEIVLNKVVAGKAFNYQPGGHSSNAWERLKTIRHQLSHLRDYRPQVFRLLTDNNQQIETAAVGVASTTHVLNSGLSRSILAENYANDGLFYSLVVAPKSLVQMLKHFLFETISRNSRQPGFIGVLRSRRLLLSSPKAFECHLDEQVFTTQNLTLEVSEKAIQLAVDERSPFLETGARHKEIRRVQHLPSAEESVKALSGDPLPWITHAATEEFKELYQTLRENAQISTTFLMFMVLSTLLATFGLYANSTPVIIGAMILAPLMAPIISLSMAFARQDFVLMRNSARTLATGLLTATGFAMLSSFLLPMQLETPEIAARLRPTLLDLGVAIISGIAGAYAYARVDAAKSLAGVAIAVALVPPLAVTGIGLGWLKVSVAFGAFLLFVTNLVGIVLAASTTFLLLGYAPFSRARKGIITALIGAAIVSVPLALSFQQLAKEATIVSIIEQLESETSDLRSVQVLSTQSPIQVRMELISHGESDKEHIRRLKEQLADALNGDVELEVNWIIQY